MDFKIGDRVRVLEAMYRPGHTASVVKIDQAQEMALLKFDDGDTNWYSCHRFELIPPPKGDNTPLPLPG